MSSAPILPNDFAHSLARLPMVTVHSQLVDLQDRIVRSEGADFSGRCVAARVRVLILKMVHAFGEGHLGSPFSIVEILQTVFDVIKMRPEIFEQPVRDRFVLSKGHACAALYAMLAEYNCMDISELETYLQPGSRLPGHPTAGSVPSVEISTGSLGNGISAALGIALAGRLRGQSTQTYVLSGDGELNEGVVWEAAMFASHNSLDNLTLLIDRNSLQIAGDTEKVMSLEPLAAKFVAFGWDVRSVDGHDHKALQRALVTRSIAMRPRVIICNCIKGKGVSFMENSTQWHYRSLDLQQLEQSISGVLIGLYEGCANAPR
jgi:transketolase